MSFYLKSGEELWPTIEGAFDIRTSLPVGTYTVCSSMKGFYLKPITDFDIRGKIYGKATAQAERILQTFADRPNSTGVLLNGEKGSGKTMLAKMISQKAAEKGMSTLVINTSFCGDAFNTFIQSIDEPCVIVFDEFEKVFDDKEQEAILTLLDGVYPTKKLFVLTVNDKYKVNSHMRNRPGRIFYLLDFKGLDTDFIEEYCNDNLLNKEYIPQITRLTLLFDSFNFDMLKALVEEMNRYNESPTQVLEMLNAKPIDGGSLKHNVEIWKEGKKVDDDVVYPRYVRGNPISHQSMNFSIESIDDSNAQEIDYEINQSHLKKIDIESGTYTYVYDEGKPSQAVFVFTRETFRKTEPYTWINAF